MLHVMFIPAKFLATFGSMFLVAGLMGSMNQNAHAGEVERLGDGAYLYRHDEHRSLFVVSESGVIVTDPINDAVATGYREAIYSVTDQPVRFVVYSHYHWDRVSGAAIFKKEGAQIVAQKKCAERFEDNPNPAVVRPDITFEKQHRVTLGDHSLDLYYFGPSHGDCLTVFVAQPAGIMQLVDVVNPPVASFPPDPLVPSIRPHNLRQFFSATIELIDQLGVEQIAASAARSVPGHSGDVSPPLASASIVRDQAAFWNAIYATVERALTERRVGIDSFVRLHKDEQAVFESYAGYDKNHLPLILRRFTGYHDMGR